MTKLDDNEDYGQQLLRESRAMARAKRIREMDVVSAYPAEYTSLWYRLRAIDEMTKQQMESMLSFLSGYTPTGWDAAYERCGAKPIYPVEGDPDYNELEPQSVDDMNIDESWTPRFPEVQ